MQLTLRQSWLDKRLAYDANGRNNVRSHFSYYIPGILREKYDGYDMFSLAMIYLVCVALGKEDNSKT